jgi:2-oxoglutaroyl-CoA hydrolase
MVETHKKDGFRIEIDSALRRGDIVLDRPRFNTITMPQRDELRLAFEMLDADERVRVIVLRAIGQDFSSGGHIKDLLDAPPDALSQLAWNVAAPVRCVKPVVAAHRGYCFSVAFELSLACDFRIASLTARYALPEQKLGQIPGCGGSARLQKIIGVTRTKDLVMRSHRIPAKQAYEWGILTDLVNDSELESATDALVRELVDMAPLAQHAAKKLLNAAEEAPLSVAIEMEGRLYRELRSTTDYEEGIAAFSEKRPPAFTGR